MIWDILKGLIIGILLFVAGIILWLAFESSHVQNLNVKSCDEAAVQSLKALSETVEDSWFQREHYDIIGSSNGQCMFFQYYQKPGALYCGQDITSGYLVGVAMMPGELHQFADTISLDTDFQKMMDYLAARAKTNPAPVHKF